MGSIESPPRTVKTSLNYFLDPSLGGTDWFVAGTATEKLRKHAPVETEITDIRGQEGDFSLDKQGFQVVEHQHSLDSFDDDEKIKTSYYEDCCALVKQHTGASEVHVLSHIARRVSFEKAFENVHEGDENSRGAGVPPAYFVHIDQSYDGVFPRIQPVVPKVAEKIERNEFRRWAIINVWMPIESPVTRDALAIADARSIPQEDLAPITIYFPKSTQDNDQKNKQDPYAKRPSFELWMVRPPTETEHKWYYFSEMAPGEAFLLKIFDSKEDVKARRSPHSAFKGPFDHGPTRQSIEVRCVVCWE